MMEENYNPVILALRDDMTRLITLSENQKENDTKMHQAIIDKIDGFEKLINEKFQHQETKLKAQNARILQIESNMRRFVWLIVTAFVSALAGVVYLTPK